MSAPTPGPPPRADGPLVRDLVVVGASAGGVEALRKLVSGLPADLPAAVLVVLHIPAYSRSALASILGRAGRLPVEQAHEDTALVPGRILVAPPDHHLLVADGHVTLSRGPRENGHRPSVDVLFRSAARAAGPRVIGVVLSGTLDDGTAGLVAIRERGGLSVVQDPDDAAYPGMPLSAVEGDSPDAVLPLDEIPELLRALVGSRVDHPDREVSELMDVEVAMAVPEDDALNSAERPGVPSGFACPDCHGVLFEIDEGHMRRFRCRVGHAWSANSLAAQQAAAVEGALWTALRALEEKAALADRMARSADARGHVMTAATFAEQALEARDSAIALRDLIERSSSLVPEPAGAAEPPTVEPAQALP